MAKTANTKGRGMLTKELVEMWRSLLDDEDLTTEKLRLLPYLQFCSMNNRWVEDAKINAEEMEILLKREERGFLLYIKPGTDKMEFRISRKFWDAISAICWHAYIAFDA